MKNFFLNPTTGKIRAGWRIVLFVLLFALLNFTLMVGVRSILGSLRGGGSLWFALLGLSATAAAYFSRKYIDKASFVSLGLTVNRAAILDVLVGVAISAAIMTCMYGTLSFTGLIQFEGFSWWTASAGPDASFDGNSLLIVLAVLWQFMVVAWWEELTFRGIFLQNISQGLNLKWGVVLSTICFGLIHASNPNASIFSTLLIILISLKLVYAYLKTGQLWLAMGLHLGWNFFQASVFGFASSGHTSPALISQTAVGPSWLSGGDFGAEHSILIIPFTLASLFAINWWAGRSRIEGNRFFKYARSEDSFQETPEAEHVSTAAYSV